MAYEQIIFPGMDLENIPTEYETTNYPDTPQSQEGVITYEAEEPTPAMESEAKEPTSVQEEMIQAMDSEEGLDGPNELKGITATRLWQKQIKLHYNSHLQRLTTLRSEANQAAKRHFFVSKESRG